MPRRDGYIPGVPCWVDTSQPDPDAAVEFYRRLFGWEFEDAMPAGSNGKYSVARLGGGAVAAVGSIPESAPPRATWNTHVSVDSADDAATTVRAAGGSVLMEPFDVGASGRMAFVTDPEGAAFCVWQAGDHKGAEVVNEPGSLNFNNLHTRDMAGAESFYGSVFGWEILALEGGFQAGRCPATATISSRPTPASASGSRSSAARRASRTSWRASTRSAATRPASRRTGA